MKTILFIYGYGGSPASNTCAMLREYLPKEDYKVLCFSYPQEDCAASVEFLNGKIVSEGVDLVIGSSLGGFIALCLDTDIPRIVLNPCMVPTVELPKLKPYPGHIGFGPPSEDVLETYRGFETGVNSGAFTSNSRVLGMFAENDELLGTQYYESFGKFCGEARLMPGGHHGNKEAIPVIVETVKSVLSNPVTK